MMSYYASLCTLVLSICISLIDSRIKSWPPPPFFTEKAKTARYLVHYAQWGVVSAISPDYGYVPFGIVQSFADGPMNRSTGIPYFYIANISDTYKNMAYNNSVSLAISQAEDVYCSKEQLDPEEPLCSRVTLTGQLVKTDDPKEKKFAQLSLFTRHPAMKGWPGGHGWNFYKLKINGISLVDFYGGSTNISTYEYFNAQP